MRLYSAFAALALWALPVQADEKIDRLLQAMQMEDVIEILRNEGKTGGQEIQETFLNNTGGPVFNDQIDRIYDGTWMRAQIADVFRQELTDGHIEHAIVFFESDLGQTIVRLENTARVAFADETIQDMATEAYESGDQSSDMFRLIGEFIEVNDLIDLNVQNAISADYNFFLGINKGLGIEDAEVLPELLAQRDSITRETETWLYSFLLMAYAPLKEAQMREHIAFSRTEAGRAVNSALFISFDQMYDQIYFKVGQAVSQVLTGSDL